MKTLVLVEHDNRHLKDATLATVTAAARLGDVHLLVAGHDCRAVAEAAARIAGVGKVHLADDPAYEHQLAENLAPLIAGLMADHDAFLAPATTTGKNLAPRVAALLDVMQVSDVIAVEGERTFKRPIYAGNAIATVESSDPKLVVTVRGTAFDKAAAEGGSAGIEDVSGPGDAGLSSFVGLAAEESERPELTSAKVIVSGGRALKDAATFEQQVYIAIGISGAIQYLAGMKDSKTIVAINKDEDAPIFQIADIGLVGDLFQIVPELTSKL